jgi:hypothetical protein
VNAFLVPYIAFLVGAVLVTAGLALVDPRLGLLFIGGALMAVSAADVLGGES